LSKFDDCEESQASSVELKQVSDEDTTYKGLPTIGKWIKWNIAGYEIKGVVLDYIEFGSIKIKEMNGLVNITHYFHENNWSYCEIPGLEEKERAEWELLNKNIGGRFCNKCKCDNKKLQICKGCFKVYYCDETCQLDNWNSHKGDCKREKRRRKPDPRYPLPGVSNDVKIRQVQTQNECHQILRDALNGNFTVKRKEGEFTVAISDPKSSDLEWGEWYELNINNMKITFFWDGLMPMDHSIPEGHPTSCCLLDLMEHFLSNEECTKGVLHYIIADCDILNHVMTMLINFKTYGTVAPFYGPCDCNPKNVKAQMSPERRELRKKWNKMFKRATADINDVQCMFSDSEEGCHNYENCRFKHDVYVKKE